MENATAAWCHAFYSLPLKAGDRILTCEAEYAANYVAFLQRAKRDGVVIDVIPSDDAGSLDVDALEAMVDDRVAVIAITWIPTNGGLVNPAAAVGKIARRHSITYLLDACQAVGQMPVDVKEIGCDFLTATGRKFLRGPRGTGFLYVNEQLIQDLEPVIIDHFAAPWVAKNRYELRSDARRFESWENSYALRAGLAASAEYAMHIGLNEIQDRAWQLAGYLRTALQEIPGASVRDIGSEKCAIVSFTIEAKNPDETVTQLRARNIMIGASNPASTRLDAEARSLPTVMRAAPHYYNTSNEIDQLISALKEL
jgi:selenocysteine lyase/cysteine desulfurase